MLSEIVQFLIHVDLTIAFRGSTPKKPNIWGGGVKYRH